MKATVPFCALAGLAIALLAGAPADAQDLQQKLAAAKQAAAKNQQALRTYSWLEKTEMFFKGELKSTKVDACRYGPDGQVQKTAVVAPPPPEKKRGLKGKMAGKKTAEIKEDVTDAATLIRRYVPPDPGMMQVVMNAGTASLSQAGPGFAALRFPGYAKKGDALTLTFESAVKTLHQIDVATWLDEPSDPVTLKVTMQALPDGTSYPGSVVLSLPSSNVEIRVTKTNYQKVVP
jgi:hypothetical protein